MQHAVTGRGELVHAGPVPLGGGGKRRQVQGAVEDQHAPDRQRIVQGGAHRHEQVISELGQPGEREPDPGPERAGGLADLAGPDRGRGRVRVQQQDAHVDG